LALCGAVTVAEMATALPRSGGDYVFVREAYGRGTAFVCGWGTFVLGFAAPTAVVSRLALGYLTSPYAPFLNANLPTAVAERVVPIGATLLILGVALVHTLGHKQSAWLQVTATIIKAAILVAIAVGGILFGTGDWNHLNAGHWPQGAEWTPLAIGLIYVGYAYAGWNAAAYMAGEIKDPNRLLPRCLIGGAVTVILLYVLVNLAYVYALNPAWMTSLKFPDNFREISQVAETATAAMFGRDAANVVATALGLSLVASVSAYVLTGPRVAFAMARDRAFPPFAGRLHPTRETPALATWTQAAIAIVMVWSGSFLELLNFTSAGLAVLMGLTVVAIFPIRRRADLPHPYRMPLYPLPPVLFLLLTTWTVGYAVYDEMFGREPKLPGPVLLSLITIAVAIPLSQLIARPAETAAPPPGR
jgi:APA family basic amino acid/polyamine antiporter